MKVVKQSVEIMGCGGLPIDGQAMLKHIEMCGRVCYKSEDKIADDSAEKFVRRIIKSGHESVLEHASITVRFVCDRGVSHEIVRHRIASYCVTGDTVIRSMNQKSWAVKELFDWQFDEQRKGRLKLITARSMDDETRTIVKNNITSIHCMGEKAVFCVRTESGRKLKCTDDHKIATPNGYMQLRDLSIGDEILSNGAELLDNPDWIKWYYLDENHTRKETAAMIGCSEATLYKAFCKYGIRKPLSDRPNRHHGYGRKGMFSEETKRKIGEGKKGCKNPHYKPDRLSLSISGAYRDAGKTFEKERCENCGRDTLLEIHHIDKNPRNNTASNVKVLCRKCHKLWHKAGTIGVFRDKIVSIDPAGIEPVYDVSMAEPHHNFVANGIVVHNCQESTRYCDYSKDKFGGEIKVIEPVGIGDELLTWKANCDGAEAAYKRMIRARITPQAARSILPTCLKTELIMTANLREWRHFLRLRTSEAAHPQMRALAVELRDKLREAVPVVFEDV